MYEHRKRDEDFYAIVSKILEWKKEEGECGTERGFGAGMKRRRGGVRKGTERLRLSKFAECFAKKTSSSNAGFLC